MKKKKKKNQVLGNILDSLVSCLSPVMGLDGDTLDRQHFNDFEVVIFHFIFSFIIMFKYPSY